MKTIDQAIESVRAFDPDAAASIEAHLSMWRRRAVAWQDADGIWVSGRDLVQSTGEGWRLTCEARDISRDQSRFYRLLTREHDREDLRLPLRVAPPWKGKT